MDKLIKKVKKDVDHAEKGLGTLKKADKKFDKKIEHAKKVEKAKKKIC